MAHWQNEISVLRAPASNANSFERTKDTQNKAFGPELMNDQEFIENLPTAFMKMNLNKQDSGLSHASRRSASKLSDHTTPLSEWSQPQREQSSRLADDQWIDELIPVSALNQPDLGDDDEYDNKSEITSTFSSRSFERSERPDLHSSGSSSHRSSSPSIAGIPETLPFQEAAHVNDLPPEMVSEIVGILTNEVPGSWGEPAPLSGHNLRASESLLHERRDIVKTIRFTGNVAWFQGTDGFITMNINGERVRDFFCHWSEIRACVQGRKSLGENEKVEFMLMDDNKGGFKCKDVTGPNGSPVKGQDLRPKAQMRQNRPRLAKVGECYEYHEGKCNRAPGHCRYSHDVEPSRLRVSRAEAARRNAVTEIPALAYHTAPFVLVPTTTDLGLMYPATTTTRTTGHQTLWDHQMMRRPSLNSNDLYSHGLGHLSQYPSRDFYLQ